MMQSNYFIKVNERILDYKEYKLMVKALKEWICSDLASYMKRLGFVAVSREEQSYHQLELIYNHAMLGLGLLIRMEKYDEEEFV